MANLARTAKNCAPRNGFDSWGIAPELRGKEQRAICARHVLRFYSLNLSLPAAHILRRSSARPMPMWLSDLLAFWLCDSELLCFFHKVIKIIFRTPERQNARTPHTQPWRSA
jgi:hypothetical protein